MEPAIKGIIDTYSRLGNRRAIEDMLIHRRQLAADLRGRTGYDFSRPIAEIDGEIAIIEAALQKLDPVERTTVTPASLYTSASLKIVFDGALRRGRQTKWSRRPPPGETPTAN